MLSTEFVTTLETELQSLSIPPVVTHQGVVTRVGGQTIEVHGLNQRLSAGSRVALDLPNSRRVIAEVIKLTAQSATAILHSQMEDIHIGQTALFIEEPIFKPSENWIGNILNHEAQRIDGRLLKPGLRAINLKGAPPPAVLRKGLGPRLSTGVLAVDTFLPLCLGQRVGLFAGSGVGKSTLLGTLAKKSHADINIIALIGERGREVRHFVDNILGPEGMAKSIIFAATSDESSAIKLRTAQLAMATAEYFRDTGAQVLYLFDSLTRYAEAHRDLAISAGEIPALRGYPPSTFRALASLCERAGPGLEDKGDITAIFSVLVAGSDMEEPVADMVRGILDGHMILEREIAERGRYPAIDIRKSVSRSLPDAATDAENKILQKARELIMTYETSRGIIQAGLYVAGSDVKLDEAIECYPRIEALISNLNIETIEAGFTALSDAIARREEQISDTGGTEAG